MSDYDVFMSRMTKSDVFVRPDVAFMSGLPIWRKARRILLAVVVFLSTGLIVASPVQATDLCVAADSGSYNISTEAQLRLMATDADCLRTGKTFTLLNAIALTSSWTPIGDVSTGFKGTFDGNDKIISGLSMTFTSSSADRGGLFGVTQGAVLKNIILTDVTITNNDRTTSGPQYIGGIVGDADNTDVLNSSVTGTIDGTKRVGGIAGYADNGSLISNSSSAGEIGSDRSLGDVGGIVGATRGSVLTNVTSSASVTVGLWSPTTIDSYYVGGIVGEAFDSNITNAVASGAVTGVGNVGGVVGYFWVDRASGTYTIEDSSASGNVTGLGSCFGYCNSTGGLIGGLRVSRSKGGLSGIVRINDSYATGNVTGNRSVGGLIGNVYIQDMETNSPAPFPSSEVEISDVFARGQVRGEDFVGGLIGSTGGSNVSGSNSELSVLSAYATGAVTGTGYVGGLVGSFDGNWTLLSSITNSYATGAVTGTSTSGWYHGGLVGQVEGPATITRSFASGTVDNLRNYFAGGLVGNIEESSDYVVTITDSYATGNTAGGAGVGALVGGTQNRLELRNTYAVGAINIGRGAFKGGVIGESSGTMSSMKAGVTNPLDVRATYWNTQSTGVAFALGTLNNAGSNITNASGLTTSQMRYGSNFAGWDFSTVWGYQCSVSVLPQLRAINANATASSCPEPVVVSSPPPPPPITIPTPEITAPTPELGGANMNLGGRAINVTVQRNPNNNGLLLTAGPLTLSLGGVTAIGRPTPLTSSGALVLPLSGRKTVNASGLLPGSTVTKTLYSNPVELGREVVDESGVLRATSIIAAALPVGNHTLTFTGSANTGEEFMLSIGIRLATPAVALGANPLLSASSKRVDRGASVLVTLSSAQAHCTVRFTAPGATSTQTASKYGTAKTKFRVPSTQRQPWTVTARVSGKNCAPMSTSISIPVRR
jgi:hypothetical protein